MTLLLTILTWVGAIIVMVGTVLPLTRSVRWWVRAWEFPRLHLALLAVACAALALLLSVPFNTPLAVAMLVCAAYQATRIFPYTPFARNEVPITENVPEHAKITILAANVQQGNRRKADLISIIDREDPDILLLMETNQEWLDTLTPCLNRYATVRTLTLENYYGMVFATRLKTIRADFVFLADDKTPSLRAELCGPDGAGFNFIGLHPRPPVPGNDTEERDEQIKTAAQLAGNADWPTVCMGDFNDVAWSWTSKRFKRYGDFLEPRVGRGMYSTFHAQYPLLSVPIDQFYLTKGIGLVGFGRLEEFGSDHFPLRAVITCHGQRDSPTRGAP